MLSWNVLAWNFVYYKSSFLLTEDDASVDYIWPGFCAVCLLWIIPVVWQVILEFSILVFVGTSVKFFEA